MKYFAMLLLPLVLFGQYDLVKDVISSGGTKATSANYVLYGTISQTTIGSVAGGTYKGIIGFWQPFDWIAPNPPDVVRAIKSSNNVVLTWNKVSTDVNGNPEVIEYYSVYRNTTPNYIPGTGTYVGNSTGPDTNYTDAGVVGSGTNYYYLVEAVDYGRNLSYPSNMGYKFRQLLNENASLTDKNWISLPYRNNYANASDFYTDIGLTVCYGIRKLNPLTQGYTTCWWDEENLEFVDDYPLIQGTAYEILVNADTSWRPAVYTNRGGDIVSAPVRERMGTMAVIKEPDWPMIHNDERAGVISDGASAVRRTGDNRQTSDRLPYSIHGRIKGDVSGLAMRCYVVSRPDELLTESVQSCGIRSGKKSSVWWGELGNLPSPWCAGDEVVVLLSKEGYYGAVSYQIDGSQDVVELSCVTLNPVPMVDIKQSADGGVVLSWTAVNDPLVIGYSVYRISDDQTYERLNDAIIKGTTFTVNNAAIEGRYELRLVFAGGRESGFYPRIVDKIADGVQSGGETLIPVAFALGQVKPNPFVRQTAISFAVAQARSVELKIYDIAGKLVRTLKNEVIEPGYYACTWDGRDDANRSIGAGVYFCKFVAGDYTATQKLVITK
jgi:hypothetical protein